MPIGVGYYWLSRVLFVNDNDDVLDLIDLLATLRFLFLFICGIMGKYYTNMGRARTYILYFNSARVRLLICMLSVKSCDAIISREKPGTHHIIQSQFSAGRAFSDAIPDRCSNHEA